MTTAKPILVGVDGSAGSYNAVRWAAVDAALRHSPLWLVAIYAKPFDVFRSASSAEIYIGEQEVAGGRLLRDATDMAHSESEHLGEVTVQTALLGGGTPAARPCAGRTDARRRLAWARGTHRRNRGICQFGGCGPRPVSGCRRQRSSGARKAGAGWTGDRWCRRNTDERAGDRGRDGGGVIAAGRRHRSPCVDRTTCRRPHSVTGRHACRSTGPP